MVSKTLKSIESPYLSMDRVKISDPESERFEKHCHDGYEFIFFVQANCEYVVEDNNYCVRSGDAILIPPGKYHFLKPSGMKTYDRAVFSFSENLFPYPGFMDEVAALGNYFSSESYPESAKKAQEFLSLCRDMDAAHSAIYAIAALTEIFLLLLSAPKTEQNAQTDSLCSRAIRYISDNLSEIQSTEDIAKGLFSSRSALQHAFRKNLDIPVMQYVRMKRLFAVRQFVAKGDTLAAAAEKAGYDDYTTFYRAHKAYFGYSPTKDKPRKSLKEVKNHE